MFRGIIMRVLRHAGTILFQEAFVEATSAFSGLDHSTGMFDYQSFDAQPVQASASRFFEPLDFSDCVAVLITTCLLCKSFYSWGREKLRLFFLPAFQQPAKQDLSESWISRNTLASLQLRAALVCAADFEREAARFDVSVGQLQAWVTSWDGAWGEIDHLSVSFLPRRGRIAHRNRIPAQSRANLPAPNAHVHRKPSVPRPSSVSRKPNLFQ